MKTKKNIIYDGKKFCGLGLACPIVEIYDGKENCGVGACPKVDHDTSEQMVKIYDPAKPKNGSFKMTVKEWNTMLKHAKPVE